jgi:two-component system, NarL family, response regulator NreC
MMATTIVLADDHPLVRQGLRTLLQAEPEFRLIGEAGDGLEATRLVEDLKPNVLVLDLMMPGIKGLEVIRQVTKHSPQTRVVVLSMYANEAYVMEALRNGAAGYVLKESNLVELVEAVRAVARGRRYLSPPLSERAIEEYTQKAKGAPLDRYEALTTREREVLHLAAEGHTNAEIGKRLFISPRTVEVHRANLMRKLELHSHTDLIRYALKRGIIPPEA